MSDLIQAVADASFEQEVLQADKPVLVDFWAPWCAPCRALAPLLDELATHYQGKLLIKKMNVDESEKVPVRFGIRSIPTLILFKNGEAQATQIGGLSKPQLMAFIDGHI